MYIAVLGKKSSNGLFATESSRANGDWACFVRHSKSAAIDAALEANARWGAKYSVLVGELTEVAKPRRDYYLKAL